MSLDGLLLLTGVPGEARRSQATGEFCIENGGFALKTIDFEFKMMSFAGHPALYFRAAAATIAGVHRTATVPPGQRADAVLWQLRGARSRKHCPGERILF